MKAAPDLPLLLERFGSWDDLVGGTWLHPALTGSYHSGESGQARRERRARVLRWQAINEDRVLSDDEWKTCSYSYPAIKEDAGIGVERLYYRGRYRTWCIVMRDERVPDPDTGLVKWACRACGAPSPRGYHCSGECRGLVDERLWRPLDWDATRWRVLRRDGHRCVACGAPGGQQEVSQEFLDLEVDHLRAVMRNPDLEFTESNLRTLCKPCHGRLGARPGTKRRRGLPHGAGAQGSLESYGAVRP